MRNIPEFLANLVTLLALVFPKLLVGLVGSLVHFLVVLLDVLRKVFLGRCRGVALVERGFQTFCRLGVLLAHSPGHGGEALLLLLGCIDVVASAGALGSTAAALTSLGWGRAGVLLVGRRVGSLFLRVLALGVTLTTAVV